MKTRKLVLLGEPHDPNITIGHDEARCETCRHWDPRGSRYPYYDDDGEHSSPDHAVCERIVHGFNDRDRDEPGERTGETNPPAFVMDSSGYHAVLWTRRDFACALWEPKL